MAARLGLVVTNEGLVTTYRRPGFGESTPDITFASEQLVSRISGWQVLEEESSSDRQYISFTVSDSVGRLQASKPLPRWNTRRLNKERRVEELRVSRRDDEDSIAQRARERRGATALNDEFKPAQKRLRLAIKASKRRYWKEVCDEVNSDPWGLDYKIVTRRIGAMKPPEIKDARLINAIVDGLFPVHPPREETQYESVRQEDIPEFTNAELSIAIRLLKSGKAPRPDGIPVEVLKVIASRCPNTLVDTYNVCLREGVFSSRWKRARLILISKGKRDPTSPSANRPLSLLDTIGKGMGALLRSRIQNAIQQSGGLSKNQHEFRKGFSTIGAIRSVTAAVERSRERSHAARPLVLVATLDVKNAFNSARWAGLLTEEIWGPTLHNTCSRGLLPGSGTYH